VRATYNVSARKRPVNLTLNEDLVNQARSVTDNLSGVVESLLADFLAREKQQRADEVRALKETIATWNTFAEKHGSFADEYSTL
jgi:post-segregation antitoxin (ccd killing protein)